jgi:hypothetical protein
MIQVLAFCLFAFADTLNLDMWKAGIIITDVYQTPGKSLLFPNGAIGMLNALPIATWFYTGIEIISLGMSTFS